MLFQVIRSLVRLAGEEVRQLRISILVVFFSTLFVSIALVVIRPDFPGCFLWVLPFWAFSIWHIFPIQRYFHLHVVGEGLEVLQVPVMTQKSATKTGIFENDFIKGYRNLILGLFALQTSWFLLLPLYVNLTVCSVAALIPIVMISALIASVRLSAFCKIYATVAVLGVIIYTVGLLAHLIPAFGFYTGVGKITQRIISPASVAALDSVNDLRKQQRENIFRGIADEAYRWQQKHPGQDLPPEFEELIRRAGGNPTLTDFFKRGRTSNI